MWDYTVLYQRKQSGDYLATVPGLGLSVTAGSREEAHQKVRELMPKWFRAVQHVDRRVEEDSEVLRLSGDAQGQLTVTELEMSNPEQVNASEIADFLFCQESWRQNAWKKQERTERKPEQRTEQKKWWDNKPCQFWRAVGRLRAERKRAAERKQERGQEDARQMGSKDHAAWRTAGKGASWVLTWSGWGAVGAVGLGAAGIALGQLGLPVPRGPLGYANLVVEGAAALLVSAIVVFMETWCWRYRAGFGLGWTLSADDITLRSPALGLVGKPDRIVLRRGFLIPEEKKAAENEYGNHKAQLGAYLMLIEEFSGKRPPYGFLVLGTGERHKIENTDDLRNKVISTAEAIRAARAELEKPRGAVDTAQAEGGSRGPGDAHREDE